MLLSTLKLLGAAVTAVMLKDADPVLVTLMFCWAEVPDNTSPNSA